MHFNLLNTRIQFVSGLQILGFVNTHSLRSRVKVQLMAPFLTNTLDDDAQNV